MHKILLLGLTMLFAFITPACGSNSSATDKSNTLKAEDIVKKARKGSPVNYDGVTIQGDLLLSDLAEQNITFANCTFEGNVISNPATVFRTLSFTDCTFSAKLSFRNTVIDGNFILSNCAVKGNADFSGALFRAGGSFNKSNFDSDASFVSAVFARRVGMVGVIFSADASFQYARFEDIIMFSDSRFGAYADFSKVYCTAQIDFTNCHFFARATFQSATFLNNLQLAKTTFDNQTTISNCLILGTLSLIDAQFQAHLIFTDNVLARSPRNSGLKKGKDFVCEQSDNRLIPATEINISEAK